MTVKLDPMGSFAPVDLSKDYIGLQTENKILIRTNESLLTNNEALKSAHQDVAKKYKHLMIYIGIGMGLIAVIVLVKIQYDENKKAYLPRK